MKFGCIILTLAAAACTLPANGGSEANACATNTQLEQSVAGLAQAKLCIFSGAKKRSFTVEIARNSMEQAKGLMFRTELADDTGMIFPFPEPKIASFWMKNTVIPLDIIFIRENGTIESIAENTVPYSTEPVSSGEPVASVLELRGGLTSELGIAAGDKVVWQSK
ncbi:DUF192 domain-containing protein [Sphingorhabdus sp. IMCC26285]|uniref:DUF192 domain-containing protein n=1 Tax=Sphingorhabdus profundilacus TaxID=2509718 RepID=A0A6I4M6B6_9SPHN|nr:DUF192 domain-containing protein [Sphingorhabdus profundilacus]MVZ97675.1 DUF192 domain-containing protein [Sphingorhabdus profundilacus]